MDAPVDHPEPLYPTTATEFTTHEESQRNTARVVTQTTEASDHRVEDDGSIRVWPLGKGKRKIEVKQVRKGLRTSCQTIALKQ
jgi:hypothetical protein